jgi:Lar family restriction alleviation protein
MDSIKPCPFCGSFKLEYKQSADYLGTDHYWIECLNCYARTGSSLHSKNAIEKWNKRTLPSDYLGDKPDFSTTLLNSLGRIEGLLKAIHTDMV